MRVALDGTPLVGNRTGIGYTTALLAAELASTVGVEVVAYVVSRHGASLLTDLPAPGVRVGSSPMPARVAQALWARIDRPRIEHWTGPVDVVHATNYVAPPARAPVIVTVNDLTFVHHPELCTSATLRYPALIRQALDRGAVVHTPTDFVAAEVAAEFRLDRAAIRTVPWGVASVAGDPAVGRRVAGSDRFVLALGTIEPRKNLPRLVDAFDQVARRHADLRLVVAGPDGWDREAFARACSRADAADRIVRLGYVDDETRAGLLSAAAVFAYPSVYEGFGIPPLEAMAVGTPVVAGRAGSLPEVLGDAAVLVDPSDTDDIAEGIARVLDDPTLAAGLEDAGRARAARYSWSATGAAFLDVYRSLAGS